ncbi:MAG: class I SAM-dependent methyltransferase [Phycisphaerales bacterium]|nr:MAG: class I SAM-dependent methyltransferase [Phycisphaerales bacterium]
MHAKPTQQRCENRLTDDDMAVYLSGRKLYGDDFTVEQINEWFEDDAGENESYAALVQQRDAYRYPYHLWNKRLLFRHLPPGNLGHVLGLGSAYGDELKPLLGRFDRITIIEPGRSFWHDSLDGVPVDYRMPDPTGDIPLAKGSADLITCFGVLHHVPNVGHVIRECARVLSSDGYFLLREPIVSMGDWRYPRGALTKRERGIPIHLFRQLIRDAPFRIVNETLCEFGPLRAVWFRLTRRGHYESNLGLFLDGVLSRAFRWNYRYHATSVLERFRPTVICLVLRPAIAHRS